MIKEDVLGNIESYHYTMGLVAEVATKWMKAYQGEGNTYGYKATQVSVSNDMIHFGINHYDGISHSPSYRMPLDFMFDDTDGRIVNHALKQKEAEKKKYEDERADRELFNKLKQKLYPDQTFFGNPTYNQPYVIGIDWAKPDNKEKTRFNAQRSQDGAIIVGSGKIEGAVDVILEEQDGVLREVKQDA